MGQGVQVDGQAEHHERDQLGQAGQRGVKAGDLAFVGGALVADEDARDEHGQEAGPVGDRGQAVDRQRASQDAQRVQALARQRDPPHEHQQRPAARHAGDDADRHLQGELLRDVAGGAQAGAGRGQQRDEQGDPDRVVGPGLALQQHPAAAADLAAAEDGEHHGRVGRRQRGAEQEREAPAEGKQEMRRHRGRRRGDQGASHPDPDRRHRRRAEPPPAHPHAAVEQDDRQRHRDDLLHRREAQAAQPRPDI